MSRFQKLPTRRRALWGVMGILSALFWWLGERRFVVLERNSTDGRFIAKVSEFRGWRTPFTAIPNRKYEVSVEERGVREVSVGQTPRFCVFNRVWPSRIVWQKHQFICVWQIEDNGEKKQIFRFADSPLDAKFDSSGCGI